MIFLGIDPGASGGLVAMGQKGEIRSAIPMPKTETDIWEWFADFANMEATAIIEKVGGFIGTPQPGSAMFKFGRSAGMLTGFLIASRIPFEEITPQKWQKAMGVTPRDSKESKTSFKNRLKSRAQQLYPKCKVTLALADAILIATYCRRKHEGML